MFKEAVLGVRLGVPRARGALCTKLRLYRVKMHSGIDSQYNFQSISSTANNFVYSTT